jgi:hypothetical protein
VGCPRLLVALARTVAIVAALAGPALADPPPPPASPGRLFGTDEAPPPGVQPAGPHVVMRLAYTRSQGAEACPDEQFFRDAVAAKVPHWAPFAPNAPWRLDVAVVRQPGGFAGSAELRDVTGSLVFKRDFGGTPVCAALLGDLARAIGIRIDPPMPGATPSPPLPPPPHGAMPIRDELAPQARPAAARPAVRLGFVTWADLATAPRPAFAVSVDAGVRVSWFSIALGGRWDPPAGSSVMNDVSVSTQLLLGELVPCGHAGWFVGCLVGELGQARGTLTASTNPTPAPQAAVYAAGGARIGAEIPVWAPRLFLRLSADLLVGSPVGFKRNDQVVWQGGTVTGGLGVGLVTAL